MKKRVTAFLFALIFIAGFCAVAQYAVDWQTIDSGGGTSTGSTYAVIGTFGQPDAGGPMTGGPYSLNGGFWAIYAVQMPGAPWLTIISSGPSEVTISWQPDTPGWVLQETSDLSAAWTNSPGSITNPVAVPAAVPVRFYRLFRP